MISVVNLVKEFKKPIRKEGVFGMLKTLFSTEYEIKKAVNNISFDIGEGEIVGYIGSNGAGKSTTIKMMCGILTPTSGNVYIDGVEPYKKRRQVAPKIGVVFGQKTQLWWDIPLIESFKVLKEMYQISDEVYKERMEFLNEVLGIKDFLTQAVRTLSLGQRMRADLAAAWLHNPKILFLDEPTIGLDVLVKERIRVAIKKMNEKYHTTVILTTHDMQDIENLCTRIIMIDNGSIIYDGNLADIKHSFGNLKTITLNTKNDINISSLNNFNNRINYECDSRVLNIRFDADEINLEEIVKYIFDVIHATDFKVTEIGVEDVVKKILEKQEQGENTSVFKN